MIRVLPQTEITLNCPFCQQPVIPQEVRFTGMRILFECKCNSCNGKFFAEVPVNAGLFYPGIIDASTGKRIDKLPFENWYLNGLVEAFPKQTDNEVKMEVINNRTLGTKPVLILNTIDSTYGHALYELFNASYYLKKEEYDLVILVQKNMAWLVPEGAAQVWIADISFSKATQWHNGLDRKIKSLLAVCDTVFVCRSFVQADSSDFDIRDYARMSPFPLEKWDERLSAPAVTFIWRTDRFWRNVIPRIFNNRITRKLFPSLLTRICNYLQFRWILRFAKAIKESIPAIDFAIAGMDERKPDLPSWIKDFRYPVHEDATARLQLERYAQSHLVVGCNGSSLLLPGCMAGSVIDIVPGDQWAVSAGTFPFRITSIGDTHFRYILLPSEVTIKRLVSIIVSVLRDRSYIELQTSSPWRNHDSGMNPYDWEKQRIQAFRVSENFNKGKGLITVPKSSS